jgi:mannose-6-phosphate isomerase-like protein (cupin superfamily)
MADEPEDEEEAEDATPPEVVPDEDADSDFAPPFVPKTFGGAFMWAKGEQFVATVLRIKEGKSVPVATQNRRDMHVMLTGGRAVLEIDTGDDVDRVELLPAISVYIEPGRHYRLIAVTEVELFTVYTPG